MTRRENRRPRQRGLIEDAVCSCGGIVGAECCLATRPGTRCPVGVCMKCGRTWRRVAQLPLVAMGAGTRDLERQPSVQPLRGRATP